MNQPDQTGFDIAIIGAGIAGVACARQLYDAGQRIMLFDKARGPGGRMAVRRVDGGWSFDLGAQYCTARGASFLQTLESLKAADIAQTWEPQRPADEDSPSDAWYVGAPAINAIPKALAADLPITAEARIVSLAYADGRWRFADEAGAAYEAATLLLSMPAPQASELLEPDPIAKRLVKVRMLPTWTVLAGFDQPLDLGAEVFRFDNSVVATAMRNNTKPGRNEAGRRESWTIHASHDWSAQHLEQDKQTISQPVFEAFQKSLGRELPEPTVLTAHRWRYAAVGEPLGEPCIWDPTRRIGLCGDWCIGNRVEAAYDSGLSLAQQVLSAT